MKIKGIAIAQDALRSERRLDAPYVSEAITADRQLTLNDFQFLELSAAAAGFAALMPDATTLTNGWKTVIKIASASAEDIAIENSAAAALITSPQKGYTYELTLTNNSTAAGAWIVRELRELGQNEAERYSQTFVAGDFVAGDLTVAVGTHGIVASSLDVTVEEGTGPFEKVYPTITVSATNDVTIGVSTDPDLSFDGRITIQ